MHNLYNLLRKAENIERVENILIYNIDVYLEEMQKNLQI